MLTCPLSVFLTSNELRRTPSLETVSFSTFFKQLLLCLLNFAFSYVHWHLSYAEAMFWAQDLSLLLNPTLNSCSITWIMYSVNSLFGYPWNNFSQFPAFHGMTILGSDTLEGMSLAFPHASSANSYVVYWYGAGEDKVIGSRMDEWEGGGGGREGKKLEKWRR